MAIQFADPGGEYYFSAGINAAGVWTGANANVTPVNSAPAGRATLYGLACNFPGTQLIDRVFAANYAHFVMGGAYYVPASFLNTSILMAFMDAANLQVEVRADATGHLYISRNGTTLGTSTNVLVVNQGWVYVEFEAIINGSTGTAQVWVNGVSWLSLTAQNTKNTANAYMNRVRWGSVTNATGSYWKDLYALDTGTGVNTSRLGDITVNVTYAAAAGPSQQWTPLSGTQLSCVDVHAARPDDTTYISDSTSGHISDFAPQSVTLPGGTSILAAVHVSRMSGDVAGATAQQYTKSGGTTHTTATIGLGTSPSYFYDVLENDPDTSTAWTQSGYNAATHGVKIP